MATQPLYTIITPCFNSGDKIASTINSVLAQRRDLFEYWVIDGGSTDGTVEVLASYGDNIRWISERANGVCDAMNKGIDRAVGMYLYFLGAGDLLRPGILEHLLDTLPREKPTLVYGNVFWAGNDPVYGRTVYAGPFDKERIINLCPNHQSIFYHRSIFEMEGRYDLDYRILADWHLNLKCFGNERIGKVYVDAVVADYEGEGTSSRVIDEVFFRRRTLLIGRHLGWRYAWSIVSERPRHWLTSKRALVKYLASRSPMYLAQRVLHHLNAFVRSKRD